MERLADALGVALGLLGYYGASILDFIGLQDVTASLNRLIQYLTPTFVMALAWILYGTRLDSSCTMVVGLIA